MSGAALGLGLGLKADKCPVPDDPHPRVLQEVAGEVEDAPVITFQNWMDSGTVPEVWKEEERKLQSCSQDISQRKNTGMYNWKLHKQWSDWKEAARIYQREIMFDKSVGSFLVGHGRHWLAKSGALVGLETEWLAGFRGQSNNIAVALGVTCRPDQVRTADFLP